MGGGTVFLPCWWFGLRHSNTRAYRLLGRARSWSLSPGELMLMNTLIPLPPVSLSPEWATAAPTPRRPRRLSETSRWVWPRLLWSHWFCPGSWCMWEFVCTLQEWSLCFPLSCGAPAIKPQWPSKTNALGVPPNARPPGWGAWCGAQKSHSCGRTSVI